LAESTVGGRAEFQPVLEASVFLAENESANSGKRVNLAETVGKHTNSGLPYCG
jgi:hypothetical protein